MKKIKLFLAACAAMLGVQTGFAQQEPINGGVYYLYNTETGTFLTRGSNWGTKAVTNEAGQPWQVSISDGKYTLRMYDIVKAGSTKGLNGYFTDNDSPLAFTLTGSATGYTISNGSAYLTAPAYGSDVLVENATSNMTWQFLNVDDYKSVLAAKQTAQEAAIATAAGVTLGQNTLSDVVGDADNWRSQSVGTYAANKTDWTVASVPNRTGNVNEGSYGVEIYQGGGSFSRTLTGLKAGIYKVGIKAMFRSNTNGNGYAIGQEGYINSSAYLNANGYIVPIKDWYSSCASDSNPNSTGQFVTIANNGGYYTEMFTYVGDAGTLALSAVSESYWGGSWFLFNSVTLTYYTDQIEDADITALVATIPTAIPTAAAENIASLRSTLESTKTIAAYNALNNAVTAAQALVNPYAAYKVALENAQIAGVDETTITAQQTAVEQATTVSGVEACTNALATAAAAVKATDITAYTITNANPTTNADGWTVSITPNAFDSGNNNAEFWNQAAATMKQTLTGLPAGSYRLTVVALQRDGCIGTIEAAGKTTPIVDVDRITANDRTAAATYFDNGNGLNYVYFTLDEASDVTIGINVDNTIDDHWTVFRSFALATYTESVAASYLKPGYDEAMAAAVAYQSQDMFSEDKTALNTAISENTVDASSATVALYESAIANLNAAATAAAAAVSNYATYNAIVAAIGENTNVDLTSYVTNADFQLNNLTGWTSVNGGSVANNGNFNSTYFVERWKNNVALGEGSLTHDPIVLPAGVYRITADAQNIEQYNSNAGGTGLFLCANDEKSEIGAKGNYSVYIKVADKEALTIKFQQDNCTGNWVAYDNVTLTYVAADYIYELVDGKMNTAIANAQAAAEERFTETQNGGNYSALMNAIAAAQTSKDAYAVAATAVAKAKALKDAHNFASVDATTTFAEAISAIETPYNEGTLADADASAAGTTLGVALSGWHDNPNGAASNYLENGFGLNDFDAALYVNTWSQEGDNDGTGFSVPFYEYYTSDANSLGEKTWTGTLSGLENGLYSVTAWVRVSTKTGTENEPIAVTDATGITMNVNDGETVDVTEGTQVGESRLVLGTFTAEGLVREGTLTFSINVAADNNISWLAFKNVKYTKVRDLTPEEEIHYATADDYEALNEAIATAEEKTIGFDAGDYAPYNNAAALAALAAAKAINQQTENEQENVQAATAALTAATWNVNTEEVNAVYDGTFAAAENNGAPKGWRMSNNTLGGDYHSRAFVGDDRMIEFNDTKSGVFLRFDGTNSNRGSMYYYGDTEGYTMPLKAGVTYYAKVDFAGWGSTGKPIRMNVTGPEGFSEGQQFNTNVRADNADNAPQQFYIVFTATVAGNYVINFQTPGADSNTHNIVISNVEVKRYAPALDEDVAYTPVACDGVNVTLKRTFKADTWSTFVVPFDIDNATLTAQFGDDVQVSTISADNSGVTFSPMHTPAITANEPVLIKVSNTANSYTFENVNIVAATPTKELATGVSIVGNYSGSIAIPATTDANASYYYIASNKLKKSTGTQTIKGFRAYFSVAADAPAGIKAFFEGGDIATGISGIEAENVSNGAIYNLAGQRVEKAPKGIFIINGKKVLVK